MLLMVARTLACAPFDVDAVIREVDRLSDQRLADEAQRRLDDSYAALPDACTVSQDALVLFLQKAGTFDWQRSQDDPAGRWMELSDAWFDRLALQGPAEPPAWPLSLPAAAEGRAALARERVARLPTGTIRAEQEIAVDGARLPAGTVVTRRVGVHLAQWDGGGRWVAVEEGLTLALPEAAPVVASRRSVALPVTIGSVGLAAVGGGIAFTMIGGGEFDSRCSGADSFTALQSCDDTNGTHIASRVITGVSLIGAGALLASAGFGWTIGTFIDDSGGMLALGGRF